jgi:membrane-bound ClpP family serine protease
VCGRARVERGGDAVLRRDNMFEDWRVWLKELKETLKDIITEPVVLVLLLSITFFLIFVYLVI